jgi:hypothetical protein
MRDIASFYLYFDISYGYLISTLPILAFSWQANIRFMICKLPSRLIFTGMKAVVLLLLVCLTNIEVFTQNTVGVLNNSLDAYEGYTLYAPIVYTSTYLLDNCGRVIKEWNSDFNPGLAAYMIPGGRLLRSGKATESNFNSAGSGGIIQIFAWNGILEWQAEVSDDQFGAHHDIEYLPNGNILLLRWEKKNSEDLIQAGKNPDFIPSEMWLPSVVEIQPLEFNSFDIIWEWHLFDHLVQDVDHTKDNYGVIADNPRKVNINYNNITSRDWGHLNSIDYSESRDEILLSSRNLDEIWIIDHSTTSEEAASDTGGDQNLGGQLLYRFGNISAYQDTSETSQLDGQHDAEFQISSENDLSILLYNNNNQSAKFAEAFEFKPKLDSNGRYALDSNRFDIIGLPIIFEGSEERNFDSPIMSSVQKLPNGNLLFNAGRVSVFVEFDPLGNEVWRYRGPVSFLGPIEQGSSLSGGTFKIERYSLEDPIFDNLDTSIKAESIELNPNLINCGLSSVSTGYATPIESSVYPNPFSDFITIEFSNYEEVTLEVYNALGALVINQQIKTKRKLNLSALPAGMYYISLNKGNIKSRFKVIKI